MRQHLEQRFWAYAQMRNKPLLETGELTVPLGIDRIQEEELLKRITRKGLLVRIKRGVYLVPEKTPPGKWAPAPYYTLFYLMEKEDTPYQVCGPTLFNKYGFETQISNRIYVYNLKLSKERIIGTTPFTFIKVKPEKLGGTSTFVTPQGFEIFEASLERTVVDALNEHNRFATLPCSLFWMREYLKKETPDVLTKMLVQFGTKETLRRAGYLYNLSEIENSQTKKLHKALGSGKSLIPLVPGIRAAGKVNTKWGVIVNQQITCNDRPDS